MEYRCAEQQGLEYGPLKACVKLHGDELLHKMGFITDLLYPAHELVRIIPSFSLRYGLVMVGLMRCILFEIDMCHG
jgi:hypothetical protein